MESLYSLILYLIFFGLILYFPIKLIYRHFKNQKLIIEQQKELLKNQRKSGE